ncbi:MAG: dephospho-CoA kinase [Desulfomicrobium escambiense]|nr:dephospho-CoA kinase [Desulfomicrobium escambiense]
MLKVAVTGGIGTGKSVVLAQLAACGAPVVDADAVVHECLRAGTPAASAIRARFGDGRHDRRRGRRPGPPRRHRLSGRAGAAGPRGHPASRRLPRHRGVDARSRSAAARRVAVAEIPLLFETGHEGDFDCVVVDRLRRRGAGAAGRRALRPERRRRAPADRRAVAARGEGPARGFRRPTPTARIEETRRQARAVWDALMRRAGVG